MIKGGVSAILLYSSSHSRPTIRKGTNVNALQQSHQIGPVARILVSTVYLAFGLLVAVTLVKEWRSSSKARRDPSASAFFALCSAACIAVGVSVWLPL